MQDELEKLKEQHSDISAEIDSLTERRKSLAGQNKAKTTQKITLLKKSLAEVSAKIEAEEAKSSEESPAVEEAIEEETDMLVVINVSNYVKVDPIKRTRFSPKIEVATERTGWVKAQIEANILQEVKKSK